MGFALTLVYVAFVFLRPQDLYPELNSFHVMEVLAGVAALGTAFSLVTGGTKPLLGGPEWRFGVAFILWSVFSVAAAVRWLGGAYETLIDLSIPFFTLVLVVANVSSRRRLSVLVAVVWACALILLGQTFEAYYYSDAAESPYFLTTAARGGIDELTDAGVPAAGSDSDPDDPEAARYVRRIRALGFLGDPNDFAQYLICLLPLLGPAWRRGHAARNSLAVLLPAAIATWGILLTRSRGGLIALGGLAVTALVFQLEPRRRRSAGIAALVLAVPAFVALFGYAQADSSAATRLEAWSEGLLMLKSSPVWGVGYGSFSEIHGRVAHNSFVQCFAETGLVGYFIWLGCLFVSLARISRPANLAKHSEWARWASALRLSMVGFLFAALFLSRTTSPLLFFLLSLLAVASAMAERGGEDLRLPRSWWVTVLAIEVSSILLVWVTSRAAH